MRAFVYANERSTRALLVLDCEEVSDREAKVPAHVNLDNVKPGMVVRTGDKAGKPNMTASRRVASVDRRKSGASSIKFESGGQAEKPSPTPAAPEK